MSEPTDDGNKKADFNDPTAPVWADPAAPQVPAPPAPPSGQPAGQYSQPQYSQPQYSQPHPGYGQSPYQTGAPVPNNTSAIILTIVSGLTTLSTCFIGIPSLVFGIMALTSNNTDPVGSRKKAKTGWVIFAINVGVAILIAVVGLIAIFAFGHSGNGDGNTNVNSGY